MRSGLHVRQPRNLFATAVILSGKVSAPHHQMLCYPPAATMCMCRTAVNYPDDLSRRRGVGRGGNITSARETT